MRLNIWPVCSGNYFWMQQATTCIMGRALATAWQCWPYHRRQHSLPVQRLPTRHPCHISHCNATRPRTRVRCNVCNPPKFEAHLHHACTGILCQHLARLVLERRTFRFGSIDRNGICGSWRVCLLLWPLSCHWPAAGNPAKVRRAHEHIDPTVIWCQWQQFRTLNGP